MTKTLGKDAPEKKYVDSQTAGGVEFSTTGSVLLLNGIAQGDDATNRIGRRAHFTSIQLKGYMQVGATPTNGICRTILVYDNQSDSAAPTIANILTAVGPNGLRNMDYRERFIILMDEQWELNLTDYPIRFIEFYRKLGLKTSYNGTGASVASIATGGIFLITCGTTPTGATSPTGTYGIRLRYNDQ